MPETRGRTLEAMDHVFKDIVSEQQEARKKAVENELVGNPGPTIRQDSRTPEDEVCMMEHTTS